MIKYFKPAVSILFLSVLFTDAPVIAQGRIKEDIQTRFKEYCTEVPYEEIFIHTDRDVYVAGEEMWFNSYLFDRQTGKPSSRSKVAYFELLNPDNVSVVQKRLLIRDGICPGNAHLPDTLSSGTYTCRIYTNWMKNFLPENAFMKNIIIVNPFRNNGFKRKIIYEEQLPAKLNIRFFPEGGTLVNGVPGKIAVKASDEYQRGVALNGVVRDGKGDSVTSFSTNGYGLASFDLTPVAGNSYYILYAGNITYLPLASDEGCSLKADYLGKDLVTITLSETGSSFSTDNQDYSLLIQAHGNINYSESFRIPGTVKTIIISRSGLSPGINHITLFNQNRKPVCERLIFISPTNSADGLDLKLSDRYQRREKVTMDLDMGQTGEESMSKYDLSISVIPVSSELNYPEMDDYMVFGTEFGYLPWNEPDKVSEKDYDNFLISAKSRWISWDKIFSENKAPLGFRMEVDVHLLSGLLNYRDMPVSDKEKVLTLSIPGKVALFYYAKTNSSGHFDFMLPVDQMQRNIIIQPGPEENNISVEIQSPYSWITPASYNYKDTLTTAMAAVFSDLGARYQVNRIFETSVKQEVRPDQPDTQPGKRFYGKPEIEIIMDDYIKLPVMQEIFFELTPGVRLRERKSGYEMRIYNPLSGNYYDESPTVLIDGVIINELTTLANLDPELVEKIDVVKTPYLTGEFMHSGIVHVITRLGKFNNLTLPDYAVKIPYRITEPVPLFTSPDYSDPEKKQSSKPDFRNTLYWNPSVKSDKEGNISVEFWTSDLAGDYIIDLQGITMDGKPVSFKKVITIY